MASVLAVMPMVSHAIKGTDGMALNLLLDFEKTLSLSGSPGPTLSITRATTALAKTTENGTNTLLREIKAGAPRFEGARYVENLCVQSEDFSTTWDLGTAAITTDQAVAPDGATTADLCTDDGLGGAAQIYVGQNIAGNFNSDYTLSVYAKADQVDHLLLQVTAFTSSIYKMFDLTNGTVATNEAGTFTAGISGAGN